MSVKEPVDLIGIGVDPGGYCITIGKEYKILSQRYSNGDLFYEFIDDYGSNAEAFAWRFNTIIPNRFEVELL